MWKEIAGGRWCGIILTPTVCGVVANSAHSPSQSGICPHPVDRYRPASPRSPKPISTQPHCEYCNRNLRSILAMYSESCVKFAPVKYINCVSYAGKVGLVLPE